jgi:hypothetical protein
MGQGSRIQHMETVMFDIVLVWQRCGALAGGTHRVASVAIISEQEEG